MAPSKFSPPPTHSTPAKKYWICGTPLYPPPHILPQRPSNLWTIPSLSKKTHKSKGGCPEKPLGVILGQPTLNTVISDPLNYFHKITRIIMGVPKINNKCNIPKMLPYSGGNLDLQQYLCELENSSSDISK